MDFERPVWDANKALELIGAVVVVGLTYHEPAGPRLVQLRGYVLSVSEVYGITLQLEGSRKGETYVLPPDLRGYFPAKLGDYRLSETGEVVKDPDFTAAFEVTKPGN
jgi:hypothetical protein